MRIKDGNTQIVPVYLLNALPYLSRRQGKPWLGRFQLGVKLDERLRAGLFKRQGDFFSGNHKIFDNQRVGELESLRALETSLLDEL